MSRTTKLLALAGLSTAYFLFVVAFAFGFSSTWPIWVFAWLFVCRFWHLIANPTTSAGAAQRMQTSWAISGVTYLGGCFVTLFLPLPHLAITPEFIATMHFPANMTGDWVDHPWKVLAFGALYFGVMAWSKFSDLWLPVSADVAAQPERAAP